MKQTLINLEFFLSMLFNIQGDGSKLSTNVQCPGDGGMDGKWEECKHSLPRPWQVEHNHDEQYDLYYWQAGQILTK